MQNKINFIIEKCGGDSLSHVLAELEKNINSYKITYGLEISKGYGIQIFQRTYSDFDGTACKLICSWRLLTDAKEAKLQNQSNETINLIATILGY